MPDINKLYTKKGGHKMKITCPDHIFSQLFVGNISVEDFVACDDVVLEPEYLYASGENIKKMNRRLVCSECERLEKRERTKSLFRKED